MNSTKAGIIEFGLEDFYFSQSVLSEDNSAVFEVKINPLVSLIWYGAIIVVLGAFILAPLGILAYATFYGDMAMLQKVEFYFDKLKEIPEVYLYLIFIVVGGNYGISVTNLLTNKKFK